MKQNTLENNAIRVCTEMLLSRGYRLVECEGSQVITAITPDCDLVYVFVDTHDKLNIDVIRSYYSLILEDKVRHMLIIYRNIVTSSVHKIVSSMNIKCELFSLNELQYNITEHELVPKHIKVGHEKSNTNKLPILKRNDPVSKFYSFDVGDIIEIHRKNNSIYYRYVK